jgi:phosphatidylinositol alpha-mannosyltransferase
MDDLPAVLRRGGRVVRIALVTQPYYPQAGGVSEHVHHTAIELRRLGHDVDIVTSRFRSHRESADGVLRIGRNILLPHLGAMANVNAGWKLGSDMDRIYDRGDYEVVHVHEPLSPTLPLVAIERAPEQTAVVGTFHASAPRGVAYRLGRPLLRRYSRRLDGRVAVSHAARRFASRYFPEDYRVIPNGVDPARFHPRVAPLEGLGPERPTILFVGRFYPRKGAQILFRALPRIAARIPDVRLLVVGGGPLEPWYRQLARRAPCDVRFLGELPARDMPRAYRSADVFVAPSTGQESFGIVHLEAMACAVPIVASDIEGYRELLDRGAEALLFPNRDATSLADAVVRVLTDHRLARSMAALGRAKAERHAWSSIARELEGFYLDVLDRKHMERAIRIRLAS